jgi:hypothetical protein
MFPAPTFSASNTTIKAMRPSLHKGGFLNRVLDFRDDMALRNFISTQSANGAAVTTADVLGLLVVPQNIFLRGYFYEVEREGGAGLILTPKLRVLTTAQPAIACDALSKGVGVVGDGAWVTANGACAGDPYGILTPDIMDVTVTAIGAGFGNLRLNIGLFFDDCTAGQY